MKFELKFKKQPSKTFDVKFIDENFYIRLYLAHVNTSKKKFRIRRKKHIDKVTENWRLEIERRKITATDIVHICRSFMYVFRFMHISIIRKKKKKDFPSMYLMTKACNSCFESNFKFQWSKWNWIYQNRV